jgi:aminoglycoside phosphotransferase (APT) family kinase protein
MNNASNLSPERLAPLAQYEAYCRLFMDLQLWEPFVRLACAQQGLACSEVVPGLAGTYPTFLVDGDWVVKFFGSLFDGPMAYQVEREAARLVGQDERIPAARLAAEGVLFPGESTRWPYLVFEFLSGKSIGEQFDLVPLEERLRVAAEMADTARRLHRLPLEGSSLFAADWTGYLSFLESQREITTARQRGWKAMPAHLIDQIEDYLLPAGEWLEPKTQPHFIHADLTRDHLLGTVDRGSGKPAG